MEDKKTVANDFYNDPVLSFENPITNRTDIKQSLIGLSGIYQWFNPVNGHSYVGSSTQLDRRFMEYTISNFENGPGKNYNSSLWHAFMKYGIDNFFFNILKLVDLSLINVEDNSLSVNPTNSVEGFNIITQRAAEMAFLHKFEQEYFDLCLPEYNMRKIAGGYGWASKKSSTTIFVYKPSDTSKNGLLYKFDYISEVVKQLNIHHRTLMRYINEKAVYQHKFIFSLTELDAASNKDYTNSLVRVYSPDSKRKATKVFAYLLDESNNATSLAYTFNSQVECFTFFGISRTRCNQLVNGLILDNSIDFGGLRYTLSLKPLL